MAMRIGQGNAKPHFRVLIKNILRSFANDHVYEEPCIWLVPSSNKFPGMWNSLAGNANSNVSLYRLGKASQNIGFYVARR